MDGTERRIYERFQARFPAKFKDTREDYGREVVLRDASASGINILTKNRLMLNDKVSLEVELPQSSSPMILNGRVVWSKLANANIWESGMQFDEVNFMKIQRLFQSSVSS